MRRPVHKLFSDGTIPHDLIVLTRKEFARFDRLLVGPSKRRHAPTGYEVKNRLGQVKHAVYSVAQSLLTHCLSIKTHCSRLLELTSSIRSALKEEKLRSLFVMILGILCLLARSSAAEQYPWSLHPALSHLDESAADYDQKLREADLKFLAETRADAIAKFAGARGITAEQATANLELIDWELTPFSNLVLEGSQTRDLRFKFGAGAPGFGKTAIDVFISERVEKNFADPDRMPRRNGDGGEFPDLSPIELLQKKEEVVKKAVNGNANASGNRYRDKRLRFYVTYGKVTIDEFAQYLRPPGDIEAAHQADLLALIERIKTREKIIDELPVLNNKDVEPDPAEIYHDDRR